MSGLPREVVKWLQTLNITWKIKVPKWDLHNGYLIAEIFSHYFPENVNMNSFINCISLKEKVENWRMIKKLLKSKRVEIPTPYLEGTIHCKEGAAGLLLEFLFKTLTKRKVRKVSPPMGNDYTDYPYQVKLPFHARSTASTAVKANLRLTEVLQNPDSQTNAKKSGKIISAHLDHRCQQRQEDPNRFGIKPTLAERCTRREPTPEPQDTDSSDHDSAYSLSSEHKGSKNDLVAVFQ